jgi:DNA topoisomerase-1
MIEFANALSQLRKTAARHLALDGYPPERVLAFAVRLLDLGFFRIGSESYAESNGSFGLATIRKRHVSIAGRELVFEYEAKGRKRRIQSVADPKLLRLGRALKARRGGGQEFLAYRGEGGWRDVRSVDINAYIKASTGGDFTAKDFRTWNATVLAALAIASEEPVPASPAGQKRAIARAVREVADYMGNTPAVCRASYIDPRVFDQFSEGVTVKGRIGPIEALDLSNERLRSRVEEAVIDLLTGELQPVAANAA